VSVTTLTATLDERPPWLETAATDTGSDEPCYEHPDRTLTTAETAKQLEYLHYR